MTSAVGADVSQAHALIVYRSAQTVRNAQIANLVVYVSSQTVRNGQAANLVVYGPPAARYGRVSQALGLVPYIIGPTIMPQISQAFGLLVYATGVPSARRNRCWTFVLDGHTFYVLDLAAQGTWLYDVDTKQWCKWVTDGYNQWNMVNGTMWGNERIIGGDVLNNNVWELDPAAVLDEGWRDLNHLVTGGIATRSRVFLSCESIRVSASVGIVDDKNGATFNMRFSDDQGQTWSGYYPVTLQAANYSQEIAWTSIGSFMAPGRLFEFSDIGGLIRIDGVDAFINDFDDDIEKQGGGAPPSGAQGG